MNKNELLNNIAKRVKVELTDEFDQNFERKAFFDQPWAPLSKNYEPTNGSMLNRTGALRQSIKSSCNNSQIVFYSRCPYAGIQNEGGIIRQNFIPTENMRRWAWAKYKESKENKYKRMALARQIQRTITIPARPFIGDHPKVHSIIEDIATNHIADSIEQQIKAIIKIDKI